MPCRTSSARRLTQHGGTRGCPGAGDSMRCHAQSLQRALGWGDTAAHTSGCHPLHAAVPLCVSCETHRGQQQACHATQGFFSRAFHAAWREPCGWLESTRQAPAAILHLRFARLMVTQACPATQGFFSKAFDPAWREQGLAWGWLESTRQAPAAIFQGDYAIWCAPCPLLGALRWVCMACTGCGW